MALADTITNLGNSIIALVGTRAKKDLSNIDEAGVEKIKSYAGGGGSNPVGTVIAYMGKTVPDGYLLMDGREVSKTTYAALYAVVGDSMGTATDPNKFVIADMTDGRYLMGSTVAGASQSQTLPSFSFAFRARPAVISGSTDYHSIWNVSKMTVTTSSSSDTGCMNGSGNKAAYTYTYSSKNGNSIYGGSKVIPISRKCLFLIKF